MSIGRCTSPFFWGPSAPRICPTTRLSPRALTSSSGRLRQPRLRHYRNWPSVLLPVAMTWRSWCARTRICRRRTRDLDKNLVEAVSKPPNQRDANREAAIRKRLEEIADARAEVGRTLAQRFPDYAALSKPQPLSVSDVSALLSDDEALVLIDLGKRKDGCELHLGCRSIRRGLEHH